MLQFLTLFISHTHFLGFWKKSFWYTLPTHLKTALPRTKFMFSYIFLNKTLRKQLNFVCLYRFE